MTEADRLLTELLYPQRCPLCQRILPPSGKDQTQKSWRELVCRDCRGVLPWIRQPYCMKCGKELRDDTEEFCADCAANKHLFTEGRSIFRYEGKLRDSMLRMKFHNKREYLDFYAAAMQEGAGRFLARIGAGCVISVPAHPVKRRERGYDQCLLLAEKFCLRTGLPLMRDLLIRTRYTLPQKGLGMQQRRANLRNAFAVKNASVLREPVLLIDDIFTTGATIDACCHVLLRCGVRNVFFLTVCGGVSQAAPYAALSVNSVVDGIWG